MYNKYHSIYMLQSVAVCFRVLQHVAACYSMLQCVALQRVAVYCSVLQRAAVCCVGACCSALQYREGNKVTQLCRVLQRVAVCCSVLQRVAVCCVAACCSVLRCSTVRETRSPSSAVRCSAWQCVAACCSVLQRVAVCCSVLQCVALQYREGDKVAQLCRQTVQKVILKSQLNNLFVHLSFFIFFVSLSRSPKEWQKKVPRIPKTIRNEK